MSLPCLLIDSYVYINEIYKKPKIILHVVVNSCGGDGCFFFVSSMVVVICLFLVKFNWGILISRLLAKAGRRGVVTRVESPVLVVGRGTQLLDLPDEVGLFVVELLVFGTVRVEPCQKLDKLILVAQQDVQDWLRFVRVSNKYLKTNYFVQS
jgi:hypothetical protein